MSDPAQLPSWRPPPSSSAAKPLPPRADSSSPPPRMCYETKIGRQPQFGAPDLATKLPPAAALQQAVVLHNFEPQLAGELLVRKGEVVVAQQSVGGGWCIAANDGGAKGLVPESYLRMIGPAQQPQGSQAQAVAQPSYPFAIGTVYAQPASPQLAAPETAKADEVKPKGPRGKKQPDWVRAADNGEIADHVLIYAVHNGSKAPNWESDQALREEVFEKLRRAGLRVVRRLTPSGDCEAALLTPISQERLETEAEFRKVSMLLKVRRASLVWPFRGGPEAAPSAMVAQLLTCDDEQRGVDSHDAWERRQVRW